MELKDKKTVSWDITTSLSCDVLVVGGGPAGIAAAIASARHKAKTCLIEKYGFIGGMATAGLVGPFMTSYSSDGKEQIVRGIFEELVLRMEELGGAIHPSKIPVGGTGFSSFAFRSHDHVTPFDPEVLKYVALKMILESGVAIHFHTQFVDTIINDDRIDHVIFLDKSGFGLCQPGTVVDASGNGDAAAAAGVPFIKGRAEDGKMQPATLFMRIGNVDDESVSQWVDKHDTVFSGDRRFDRRPKQGLFASVVKEAKKNGDFPIPRDYISMFRTCRKGEWLINSTRVQDVDGTSAEDLNRAEIEGREQAMILMRFFRKYCPGFKDSWLIDTGTEIGIRETRHIKGEYELTYDDVLHGRKFEDAIARYAFPMDLHSPTDNRGDFIFLDNGIGYYEIPYRCLIPAKIKNLLTAGRCISADYLAAGSLRVMPACFATGQAAGTAAAQSSNTGKPPGMIDTNKLRQTLKKDGVYI